MTALLHPRIIDRQRVIHASEVAGVAKVTDVEADSSDSSAQRHTMAPILPVDGIDAPFLGVQQTYIVDQEKQTIQPIPHSALTISVRLPSSSDPAVQFFHSCIPDPAKFLMQQHAKIRAILEQDSRLPVRYRNVTLALKDEDGLADTQGDTITLSLRWIASWAARNDVESAIHEFQGVITHELVHVMQYDGNGTAAWWWIEGLADYVRLQLGLAPRHWGRRGEGGSYEDGYATTAHWLAWIQERKVSAFLVRDVNARLMEREWQVEWIEETTGLSAKTLWNVYKAQH